MKQYEAKALAGDDDERDVIIGVFATQGEAAEAATQFVADRIAYVRELYRDVIVHTITK